MEGNYKLVRRCNVLQIVTEKLLRFISGIGDHGYMFCAILFS